MTAEDDEKRLENIASRLRAGWVGFDAVAYETVTEAEDMPVEGNYMATGDDAADRAAEREVIRRLERGDDLAWCVVGVTASVTVGGETIVGRDSLGGCCLSGESEVAETVEAHGMRDQALWALAREIDARIQRGRWLARMFEV